MDMGFSCRKNAFFRGAHKIGAPIAGPRIADKNFTDTRTFLNFVTCPKEFPPNLLAQDKITDELLQQRREKSLGPLRISGSVIISLDFSQNLHRELLKISEKLKSVSARNLTISKNSWTSILEELPREYFKVILCLRGYFYIARLFLETL